MRNDKITQRFTHNQAILNNDNCEVDENKTGQIGLKIRSIKMAKNPPVPTRNKLDFKLTARPIIFWS